jgi:hypothetical protein
MLNRKPVIGDYIFDDIHHTVAHVTAGTIDFWLQYWKTARYHKTHSYCVVTVPEETPSRWVNIYMDYSGDLFTLGSSVEHPVFSTLGEAQRMSRESTPLGRINLRDYIGLNLTADERNLNPVD